MSEKIIQLSAVNFEQTIKSAKQPILVDFWAEWCAPCKIITPILEEIAEEYTAKLIIGKLNIEENDHITTQYSIRSIPTLVLMKKEVIVATHVGILSKSQLKVFLDKHLENGIT